MHQIGIILHFFFCNFLSFQGEGQVVFVLISSQIFCWAEVFPKKLGRQEVGWLPPALSHGDDRAGQGTADPCAHGPGGHTPGRLISRCSGHTWLPALEPTGRTAQLSLIPGARSRATRPNPGPSGTCQPCSKGHVGVSHHSQAQKVTGASPGPRVKAGPAVRVNCRESCTLLPPVVPSRPHCCALGPEPPAQSVSTRLWHQAGRRAHLGKAGGVWGTDGPCSWCSQSVGGGGGSLH